MKVYAALAALALAACAPEAPTTPSATSGVQVADYSLAAFGDRLLGTDRGEWIGQLVHEAADGSTTVLLKENVHGILRNHEGVFVLTGLAHLGANYGRLYEVSAASGRPPAVSLVSQLEGAPSQIEPQGSGSASFLVFTGRYDPQGRQVFACFALTGRRVQRSRGCRPPPSLGSNYSSKPTPLRGAA